MIDLSRAQVLIQQRKYDLAEKEVKLYIGENPDDGFGYTYLAIVYGAQDKKKEALESAQKGVGINPDHPFAHYVLAKSYLILEQNKKAEESIETALQFEADDVDYLNLHAAILNDKKEYDQALGIVERALQLDPEHGDLKQTKSIILRNLGRYEEADTLAHESLTENPEDSDAFATKGWSSLDTGKTKESLELFKQAVMIDPNNEFAKSGLVMALKAQNPLFNLFYKYYNWISSLSSGARWGLIIGAVFLARIVRNLSATNTQLAPVFGIVFAAYVLFVFLAWTINPIFNIFLRFNRYGKYALTKGDTMGANVMAALLISAVVFYGLTFITDSVGIAGAIGALFLSLPVAGTFSQWGTSKFKIHAAYTILLGVLWILNIVLPIIGVDLFILWLVFLIGVIAYTWLAQIL